MGQAEVEAAKALAARYDSREQAAESIIKDAIYNARNAGQSIDTASHNAVVALDTVGLLNLKTKEA